MAEKEYWRWDEYNWKAPDIEAGDGKTISAGVDVGSVSTQAVVLADGELYAYANMRTGYNSPESANNAMKWALEGTGLSLADINYTIGTGYGRVKVPFANKTITEIACHARGANFMYGSTARTVLDMGGQDLKVIRIDQKGKVLNFLMNEKCAAGTGRGMEVMSDLLAVPIKEVGKRSFDVDEEPPPVSTTCVLFAKSEAMGLLSDGWPINNILAAYCSAMAHRVYTQVLEVGIEEEFVITGGIAKNIGVTNRLLNELQVKPIKTDYDTQIAGALGAALFARVIYEKEKSRQEK